MLELGTRANNNEIVFCAWCKFTVEAGEQAAETFVSYGHNRCYRRVRKGLSNIENRNAELKYQIRRWPKCVKT